MDESIENQLLGKTHDGLTIMEAKRIDGRNYAAARAPMTMYSIAFGRRMLITEAKALEIINESLGVNDPEAT